MFPESSKDQVIRLASTTYRNGGWIGMPYEEDGCLKFLKIVFAAIGIDIDISVEGRIEEARLFKRVEQAQFGDVVEFKGFRFAKRHVGFMLDHRFAIQSCEDTNGVGRVDIWQEGWPVGGFYRHVELCF